MASISSPISSRASTRSLWATASTAFTSGPSAPTASSGPEPICRPGIRPPMTRCSTTPTITSSIKSRKPGIIRIKRSSRCWRRSAMTSSCTRATSFWCRATNFLIGFPGSDDEKSPAARPGICFVRAGECATLLQRFAMLGDVEALDLVLLRYPQRHHELDHLEDDEGGDARPHRRDGDAVELDQHLAAIAFEQAGGAGRARRIGERGDREHAAQQGAKRAADAVDAEHVERVVIVEFLLEPGAGPVADRAREQADDQRMPGQDEAGRRRDSAETGDRARDHAEHRRLAARPPFD